MNLGNLFKNESEPEEETPRKNTKGRSKLSLFSSKSKKPVVDQDSTVKSAEPTVNVPAPKDQNIDKDDDVVDFDKELDSLNDDGDLNDILDDELNHESQAPASTPESENSSINAPIHSQAQATPAVSGEPTGTYDNQMLDESNKRYSKEAYDRLGQEADKYRDLYEKAVADNKKALDKLTAKINKQEVTMEALQSRLQARENELKSLQTSSKEQIDNLEKQLTDTQSDREEASKKLGKALADIDAQKTVNRYRLEQLTKEANDYKEYVLKQYRDKFGVIDSEHE